MSVTLAAAKPKPGIYFRTEVWDKIMYWVRKTDLECSGFGIVKILKDGSFEVVDAMMLPQKNSRGDTEIDGDGIAKALFHYKDNPDFMNFWWHSHHKMGVFWSGTDMQAIKLISSQGWCLATVFNHRGEHRSAVQYQVKQESPWGIVSQEEVFIDELPTYRYDRVYPKEVTDAWDEEFKKNDAPKPVKLVEKYRSLYLKGGALPGRPNGITEEEFGAWRDKYGESSYGEPGKPGYCGQYGYVDDQCNFNRYQGKKHRKNIFKMAAKLAGKTRDSLVNLQEDDDDKQVEIDFTNTPDTSKGIERINFPQHLEEYKGVESLSFKHVPSGHTRGSYLALLDRYRYLLEMDEVKLNKLIIEETPPKYDGFVIQDMKELVCCQEDILEGGDAHQKYELGIQAIEAKQDELDDAELIAEYEGMYGRRCQ